MLSIGLSYNTEMNDPLNDLLNDISLEKTIGLSVALLSSNKIDTLTYGLANIQYHYPMTPQTKVVLASNTKPLVMALTLIVMDKHPEIFSEGLETSVYAIKHPHWQQVLADIDPEQVLRSVNMNHLLMESSGLHDFYFDRRHAARYGPDMVEHVLTHITSTAPDPHHYLSLKQAILHFGLSRKNSPEPLIPQQSHNTDMLLLSMMLELVTGQSLNQLLNEKILKPLGLPSDSIVFEAGPIPHHQDYARRYALLNSDQEVDDAVAKDNFLPGIDATMARKLTPSHLRTCGHTLHAHDQRLMLDINEVDAQGFDGIGVAYATPQAYTRFFQALGQGSLLRDATQFEQSFIPSTDDTSMPSFQGFASIKLQDPYLIHTGFVIGGESLSIYDKQNDQAIMIARNSTVNFRDFPCFMVNPITSANTLFDCALKHLETMAKR